MIGILEGKIHFYQHKYDIYTECKAVIIEYVFILIKHMLTMYKL